MSVQQRDSSKLLWGIVGGLVAVILLVVAYQWLNAPSDQQTVTEMPAETKEANSSDSATEPTPVATATASTNALVKEDILTAPVLKHPTLAKEELSRLDDVQRQLQEQTAALQAQHQDADELIRLKEEQIKLLEAQLAEKS